MAFVSVQDPTQPTTSPISGMFNVAQNEPTPPGYIGEIDDSDPRIATFQAEVAAAAFNKNS